MRAMSRWALAVVSLLLVCVFGACGSQVSSQLRLPSTEAWGYSLFHHSGGKGSIPKPQSSQSQSSEASESEEQGPQARMVGYLIAAPYRVVEEAGDYDAWRAVAFHAYTTSRVRYPSIVIREPQTFGPWSARDDFEAEEASATGEITQWLYRYYITHSWSEYGQQILGMIPGDVVRINDTTFEVQGIFDYPKDCTLAEILDLVGDELVVIQTCVPDADYNRFVYGEIVS